jgi:hypothetical protein
MKNETSFILRLFLITFFLMFSFGLSGCSSVQPKDYATETPKLSIETFFNGTLDVHGMVHDRSGKVLRRFTMVMNASWNGSVGTLNEELQWSDGEKESKTWTLTKIADGKYEGTMGDVVGKALNEVSGNTFQMLYVVKVPIGTGADKKTYEFDVEDWMHMIDEKTLLSRTTMTKFGVRVANVTVSYRKR